MTHRPLYPALEPYRVEHLQVSSLHRLYIEQSGNPDGVPVVFLHGGPGGGSTPAHRRFFDPARYRIIVYDQRGAGKSTPLGETRENSTALLVEDIETIRRHFDIDRWHVFGGSWGSTLALAYAQANPDACRSLTLRGIFLLTPREIAWFLSGMQAIFPEAWRDFAEFIPEEERHDLLEAYSRRLESEDRKIRLAAANSWSRYEGACSSLIPRPETAMVEDADNHAIALARLEAHYMKHHAFLGENDLLRNIDRIRRIPAVIVQGRYDIVCPIRTADELHHAWPEADYIVVPDAGHSAMEPGTRSALLDATDRFASFR
jgi:proline iminopeptidase